MFWKFSLSCSIPLRKGMQHVGNPNDEAVKMSPNLPGVPDSWRVDQPYVGGSLVVEDVRFGPLGGGMPHHVALVVLRASGDQLLLVVLVGQGEARLDWTDQPLGLPRFLLIFFQSTIKVTLSFPTKNNLREDEDRFSPRSNSYQSLELKVVGESVDEGGLANAGLAEDEDGKTVEGLEVADEVADDVLGKEFEEGPVLASVAAELVVEDVGSTTGAVQVIVKAIFELEVKKKEYSHKKVS